MRINSKAGTQSAAFDGSDAGEGLAIFLSQNSGDVSRYRILVKAMLGEGVYQVGTLFTSPPGATSPQGRLSRMVGAAVCPGATSWEVEIQCADSTITPETADIILASSKCCTAPVGVSRVAERYGYNANSGTQTFTLKPGQTVTRISATGLGGGGSVFIEAGDTITVPAGITVELSPKAVIPAGVPAFSRIQFTAVDWFVEFLESA